MKYIAICDDQQAIHIKIVKLLELFYVNNHMRIFHYYSGEKLLESPENFDIIFMDIEMENINGIETAREIRKTDVNVFIVIISGFNEYKSTAYSIHAFDYLDKPLDEDRVFEVLRDIERASLKKEDIKFMTFKGINGLLKFKINDIFYFEYCDRKIKIKTVHGDFYFYDSISEVAKRMKPYGFEIPHRAYIVNFYHVIDIDKKGIILSSNDIVSISRNRITEFRNKYNQYLGAVSEIK